MEQVTMHPQTRIPIIFHDQINLISKDTSYIIYTTREWRENKKRMKYLDAILPQVHTLKSKNIKPLSLRRN